MRLPKSPPDYGDLVTSIKPDRLMAIMASGIGRMPRNEYLHWDRMRFKIAPEGFTNAEWWAATKLSRAAVRHPLPFVDKLGGPFSFTEYPSLYHQLHQIDQRASGHIEVPAAAMANKGTRERYVMRSLVEEAITSSQLEGAATTRVVAKEMLRTGRSPRDTSEQMIVNNYHAMEFIRDNSGEDLTEAMLLELQRILTEKTLRTSSVGRFRRPGDAVHVVDMEDNIIHTPPAAEELGTRLAQLLAFANTKDEEHFIHPVVRAILLHFMIGYDHPFVDGNGRTARALFYWSMARSEYWLMEFISISRFIRKSYASYGRAYLYSESDDNDVTYFLNYNLRIIKQCIDDLHIYLVRKLKETRRLERMFREGNLAQYLNHRQKALLAHMVKHPETVYTIDAHRRSNNVSYHTARKDLDELARLEFLAGTTQRGRKLLFTMNPSFSDNLRDIVELLN
ncbi:MAG: Fic family protein [Gammaproteobacteria bacterium]|nr:Fic family protein [Gammaproteobacteria bacterium]MYF31313.1 Fic family protein [Gammaproteobacteria bacterium]MYK47798.1 Fic family protein [Gammaproteobacteria bacterium]